MSLRSILSLGHLIGLALGVGGATAKFTLLLHARADRSFLPSYLAVMRPITRLIITGLVLLTASGVGWLMVGYRLTSRLAFKLGMVAVVWILGPLIDHVAEPAFNRLSPDVGEPPTSEFLQAERRYFLMEAAATALFYIIIVTWVLG